MASQNHVIFKHKLVHLDLKGAPPNIEYLEKVLPLMSKWGATGLLVEYEDCFPYSGHLQVLHTQEPYSTKEIDILQRLAAENSMIIIPLVQTFGHMEFVLKHAEFQHMREVVNFPMALCPTNPDSLRLVCSMVDQVMAVHTNLQWFHIGCDEVYHLAKCDMCRKQLVEVNLTAEQLFFNHVKSVARHIKEHYPSVTPIVWDDMFRYTDAEVLKESGMGDWVEPMVWHYVTNFELPTDLWERLSSVFPNIWIASAYKGATGPRASVSSVSYHLENHLTWFNILQEEQHRFSSIQGCALTGWQRYDHYAVLCELLPQALPSLGICLKALDKGNYDEDLHQSVSDDLGFTSLLPLNPFACQEIPQCSFPGSVIYQLMIEYAFIEASCDRLLRSEGLLTWMNEYNVRRSFTNPVHVEPIYCATSEKLCHLEEFRTKISAALSEVFFPETSEEWQGTHLLPLVSKFRQWQQTASQQLAIDLGSFTMGAATAFTGDAQSMSEQNSDMMDAAEREFTDSSLATSVQNTEMKDAAESKFTDESLATSVQNTEMADAAESLSVTAMTGTTNSPVSPSVHNSEMVEAEQSAAEATGIIDSTPSTSVKKSDLTDAAITDSSLSISLPNCDMADTVEPLSVAARKVIDSGQSEDGNIDVDG